MTVQLFGGPQGKSLWRDTCVEVKELSFVTTASQNSTESEQFAHEG